MGKVRAKRRGSPGCAFLEGRILGLHMYDVCVCVATVEPETCARTGDVETTKIRNEPGPQKRSIEKQTSLSSLLLPTSFTLPPLHG